MRKLIVAFCLLATVYTYHQKYDFNIVFDEITYSGKNTPKDLGLIKKPIFKIPKELIKEMPFTGSEAVLNDYADKIFANVQNLMIHLGLDPMQLPDQHTGFNYTLLFITYHGELDLTSGWLQDLSTLRRGGDVVVSYSNKYLTVKVPLAFDDLQFTFDYSAKIMDLGPTGGLVGKITNIKVDVEIGFNVENFTASLDKFDIVNTGHINLDFNGNALVDWLFNLLTDVVTALLKPLILAIVENVIGGGLEDLVDTINNGISDIINPTTVPPATTVASRFVN